MDLFGTLTVGVERGFRGASQSMILNNSGSIKLILGGRCREVRTHLQGIVCNVQLGRVGDARLRAEPGFRSEEHTSELQSLMRISYAVFCLKKKNSSSNTS